MSSLEVFSNGFTLMRMGLQLNYDVISNYLVDTNEFSAGSELETQICEKEQILMVLFFNLPILVVLLL